MSEAKAARITVIPGKIATVSVSGPFEYKDENKFRDSAASLTNALVLFNSLGGNLNAGIEIGTIIRLKGFATGVARGNVCASACGFAWLGGSKRYMGTGALIGFHAASLLVNGEQKDSSGGNALAGAYLNRIGLSDKAVFYITNTPSASITWMSPVDALQNGIEVEVVPSAPAVAATPPAARPIVTPPPPTPADLKMATRLAGNFHHRYQSAGMVGINTSIDACYSSARVSRHADVVTYCMALDMMAYQIDKEVSQRLKMPQADSNGINALTARLGALAKDLGFDEKVQTAHSATVMALAVRAISQQNSAAPITAPSKPVEASASINQKCSQLADERELHGEERMKFRAACKMQP